MIGRVERVAVEGGADEDAGEFSVDGDERVAMEELSDEIEFMKEIEIPDLTGLD